MAAEEATIPNVTLNNGALMPMVGLGTWRSKPGEVSEAVYYAIKNGYRHIDCAECYGNEEEVGEGIARALQENVCLREDLFITSKLWSNSHHCDDVEPAIDVTLNNLKLAYLDLYLIHWPTNFQRGENKFPKDAEGNFIYGKPEEDFRQTWPAMEALVMKNKARAIGLSNFNSKQIDVILGNSTIKPAVLQIECHPYCTQKLLQDYCQAHGIVITAYSPLGSPGRNWENSSDPSLLEDEKIQAIADRLGKTNAQVLIRFSVDRGMVVIPKSVTPSRILSNFDVANFSLSEEDVETLLSYNKNWHAVVPQIELKEKKKEGVQKVLMVSTSASKMGEHETGAWSEEITGAYYTFLDAGCDVHISSVKGGEIPIDQGSLSETYKTENDERFDNDEAAKAKLKNSLIFEECDPATFDAGWFAGGHGTCVDFADLGDLVSKWWASEKVVGSVCHGQTCLVNAKKVDGTPLVENKRITSFTDLEETQVGLHETVPFLLESRLKELGCQFLNGDPWSEKCVRDGNLITGQNPQSTVAAAKLFTKVLQTRKKKVLMVSTSASKMGEHKTGAWSEEITGAYYTFLDADCDVYISSVKGGEIPIDQGSLSETYKTENDERFDNDEAAKAKLKNSLIFEECDSASFDAVWFAGGHGTCVDFADLGDLVSQWWASEKVVGSVCHGQTCLVNAKKVDGTPLVENKRITSFTDIEETQVGLHETVPFLLESRLKELGCQFLNGDPWSERCVRDGNLITGQNPQSTVAAAKLFTKVLQTKKKVPRDLKHPNFPFGIEEEFLF